MGRAGGKVVAMIASPLEAAHAERIAAAYPDRVELIYRPDLLPPARYLGDHNGDPAWRRTPAQQAEWHELLRRVDVLWDLPAGEPAPLTRSPGLRWVQTTSAGVGPLVDRLGLRQTDVLVTTASGIHAQPLTEFVFAALLAHTKRFAQLRAAQRDHHWQRLCTGELRGRVMAIVGPGRIGREVVRVARCFGMTVWAMAREHDPARAAQLGVDRLVSRTELPALLAAADCLVLCAPHTSETAGMIGAAELAMLKPSVVLINIARGALIDEGALIAALQAGRIAFAALDVFRVEPLPQDSPLWDLPNVLINPHSASTADTENTELTDRFIVNLGHYLEGATNRLAPLLDKTRLY